MPILKEIGYRWRAMTDGNRLLIVTPDQSIYVIGVIGAAHSSGSHSFPEN
jgi:hypothetical protein